MIAVAETLSLVAVFIHLALMVWCYERDPATAVWPLMAATVMVILSGLGFSAITGGAAAPGLWLAWQAAVLAVGIRLYLSRRRHGEPGRPEPD